MRYREHKRPVMYSLPSITFKNHYSMKNKFGFNHLFAILSLPLVLALLREFDDETYTFKNTPLAILYLTTLCFTLYLDFKKKKEEKGN